MAKAQKPKADDQVKAFRKAARELGCDESEERFQDALRTLAKHRPKETKTRDRKKS
jgi:hypothetical protein